MLRMLKTYTIELRVDFDTEEKQEIALNAVRAAAHQLLTTTSMIADKRKPQIAITAGDLFEGTEDVGLFGRDD